jgi:hypothetical protein
MTEKPKRLKVYMAVEDFDLSHNLMLEWAWRKFKGRNITICPVDQDEAYTSLVAFERQVKLMAKEVLSRDVIFPHEGNPALKHLELKKYHKNTPAPSALK